MRSARTSSASSTAAGVICSAISLLTASSTGDRAIDWQRGVEMAIFHAVDPAQIGDDPVPRLASLIAERLDDLKIASSPLSLMRTNMPTSYRRKLSVSKQNKAPACDYTKYTQLRS